MGPNADAIDVRPDQRPTARPRCASGNDAPRMARLVGTSRAAAIPWKARAAMRVSIPGARPHAAEERAKATVPIRKTFRLPIRSPRAPPTRTRAERKSRYASTTHWTCTTVAPSRSWSTGRTTVTTVLSTKARLDPRTVAARIHPPRAAPGAAHGPDAATTPPSHGPATAAIAAFLKFQSIVPGHREVVQ
jgi:hypothetical protein